MVGRQGDGGAPDGDAFVGGGADGVLAGGAEGRSKAFGRFSVSGSGRFGVSARGAPGGADGCMRGVGRPLGVDDGRGGGTDSSTLESRLSSFLGRARGTPTRGAVGRRGGLGASGAPTRFEESSFPSGMWRAWRP